jgi:hypothetical protein
MKKTTLYTYLLGLVLFSACYIDDGTVPDPNPLPYDSFGEFFESNRAQKDTLSFDTDELTILAPSGGNTLTIPPEAFSEEGLLSIAFLELAKKSDFILYEFPTVVGNTWLETTEAMFIEAFDNNEPIENDSKLGWELDVFSGTSTSERKIYRWNDGWNLEDEVEITEGPLLVQFQGEEGEGYVAAKPLDVDAVQLTVNPTAYGNIPHDMRVFVVTEEGNTVLTLDPDISAVSATGSVPKGIDLKVIVMVMDYYRLDVGIETINLDSDSSIEIRLDKMTTEEMMGMIREID